MSYKISKELFEKVMNVKLTTDLSIAPYYNEVNGCEEEDLILINYNFIWIPLDTFFFKCKEWAFEQAYQLESCKTNKLLEGNKFESIYMCGGFYQYSVIQNFYASSEQQAVFDACQWIMDKDKQ